MPFSVLRKRKDTFDYQLLRICKNCGNEFHGHYCNICSEKVLGPEEYSTLNFFDSLLSAFTPIEGKFLNSVKLLFAKPGQLSRNIADGIRVPYMKMLSLFFLANFLYFLFPVWDSFNTALRTQMNSLPHRVQATRIVTAYIQKHDMSLEEFTGIYEAKSGDLSKLLLIILPVTFTLAFFVINYSKKMYFFEHMLISLEFYSFHLLFNMLFLSGLSLITFSLLEKLGLNAGILFNDNFFTAITMVTVSYFLIVSQIRFYHQRWYLAIAKSLILIAVAGGSLPLYRQFLFYVTMWSL